MDPRHGEQRVLVVRATRGTGTEIVKRLLRDGFRVRALARDEKIARRTLSDNVEIVQGDVTRRDTLAPAMREVQHVIFTAGVTKRPASQRSIIAVEYDGVKNTLAAAREAAVNGRFLYMTAIGVTRHSIASIALNLIKGRTLAWRRRADAAEVFVQALQHSATRRTTFDATWSREDGPTDWEALFRDCGRTWTSAT